MNKPAPKTSKVKRGTQKLKNSIKEIVKSPAHGIIGETKPRKVKTSEKPIEEPKKVMEAPKPIKYHKHDLQIGSVISLMKKKPNKKGHKSSSLFVVNRIDNGIAIAINQNEAIHDKIRFNQRLAINSKNQLYPRFAGLGGQSKYEIGFIIKP